SYTNLAHRMNWGLIVQQVPLLSGGFGQAIGSVDGQQAYMEQLIRYRQTMREVGLLGSYAISRVRRIEGSVGFSNITFTTDIRTKAWELFPGGIGNQILDSTVNAPRCLNGQSFRITFCAPGAMN